MAEENFNFDNYTGLLFRRRIDIDQRTLLISEDIDNKTFVWFDQAMNLLEATSKNKDPITVKINTYGGDVYEMFAIIERAQNSDCPIITEGYGKIMSCGVLLLAMGDTRYISEYATLMCHHINYGVLRGHGTYVKNEVKHSEALEKMFCSYLAKKTKKPYLHWMSTGKLLDHYIDAQTAIDWGIADAFLSSEGEHE